MMSTILVPLDGTTSAASALPHALGLAARFGGRLRLLTARDEAPRKGYEEQSADRARQRWEYLAAIGRQLNAHVEVVAGQPAEVIVREAGALEADLVVMGLNSQHGPVADYVARNAPCPVLLIPSGHPTAEEADRSLERALAGDYPRYRRILARLDGTASGERSLGPAIWLAQADSSCLALVGPPDKQAYLAERALRLRDLGCELEPVASSPDLTVSAGELVGSVHGENRPHLVVRGTSRRFLSCPAECP